MKIAIYLAIYRRRTIAPLVIEGLKRFIERGQRDVQICIVCIYTEFRDQVIWSELQSVCEVYFVHAHNRPLGQKFNAGLGVFFEIGADYMMQIGCDDILLPSYWDAAYLELQKQRGIVGVNNMYFWQHGTKNVRYLERTNIALGAGRFLKYDLLERASYCIKVVCLQSDTGGNRRGKERTISLAQMNANVYEQVSEPFWELWEPERDSALDTNSLTNLITRSGMRSFFGETIVEGQYLLDIKTKDNIHPFDKLPGSVPVTMEAIKEFL